MKVLFLDIDGVLNVPGTYTRDKGYGIPCEWRCVRALNWITETTGAQIVISSDWRYQGLTFCRDRLADMKVTGSIIGMTPFIESHVWLDEEAPIEKQIAHEHPRGAEIQLWLREHPEVDTYVILDDDGMGPMASRLVQTNGALGLTYVEALRAVKVLNAPIILPVKDDEVLAEMNKPGAREKMQAAFEAAGADIRAAVLSRLHIPKFASEGEEAAWWDRNKTLIEKMLARKVNEHRESRKAKRKKRR